MNRPLIPLPLILIFLLCAEVAAAQDRVNGASEKPAAEVKQAARKPAVTRTESAKNSKELPEAVSLASTERKESDVRLRELEDTVLQMQETIRRLSEEVGRLRNASGKDPVSVSTTQAAADSSPPANPTLSTTEPGAKPEPQDGATQQDKSKLVESALPGVKPSGTVLLYAYSPLGIPGARSFFDLYSAGLNLDREGEHLGFHLEFRFRSTKLRQFFDGPSWVQEAYVKAKAPGGTVKIGRIYKQLGIFSDYSFFGDLAYFDGLKYDPEWGVSMAI